MVGGKYDRTGVVSHALGCDGLTPRIHTGELFEDAEREQQELGAKSKLHLIILDEVRLWNKEAGA